MLSLLENVTLQAATACPTLPPGVQVFADQVTGWIKAGVLWMLGIALFMSLGAILGGKALAMPHASKAGVVGVTVTIAVAIAFVTLGAVIVGITQC